MSTRIGPDQAGEVVTVAPGQQVELVLPENAGTGYRWELDPLPEGMRMLDDRTELGSSTMAGAAGHRVFTVRVDGSGSLTARLRRRWEPAAATDKTYTVRVVMR